MNQPELLNRLACCRSQPAGQEGVGYLWATPALRVSPSPSPPPSTRLAALMSSLSCCSQCPLTTARPQSQLSQPSRASVRVSQCRPADCQWRQELSHSPTWSCYKDFSEVGLASSSIVSLIKVLFSKLFISLIY